MLSFNFTHLDIDHSRGFGIITSNTKIVQEAIKLFAHTAGTGQVRRRGENHWKSLQATRLKSGQTHENPSAYSHYSEKDSSQAFIGSQSLREAELDSRREVGLIFRESKIVKQLINCFESDWSSTDGATVSAMKKDEPAVPKKHVVRATKVLAKELHPLEATVKKAVKKVVAEAGEDVLADKRVKTTVKKMVKEVANGNERFEEA